MGIRISREAKAAYGWRAVRVDPRDERTAFEDYRRAPTADGRNRLVRRYLPLVSYLADRMASRMP
ncbi:MAG TPA: hypothetical protein VJB16_01395, partial [archaeon]|nr:hypothetical protein [archaeon]